MPTSKKDSSMVVTRDWNFPRVFITDSLDARMIGSFANAFHELIFEANFDDKAWASRMETFRKHGLLDLAIPLTCEIGPLEFDIPDGEGGTTRVVREFDKPLSWGIEKHHISIVCTHRFVPAQNGGQRNLNFSSWLWWLQVLTKCISVLL